jgi:hypothetical protein
MLCWRVNKGKWVRVRTHVRNWHDAGTLNDLSLGQLLYDCKHLAIDSERLWKQTCHNERYSIERHLAGMRARSRAACVSTSSRKLTPPTVMHTACNVELQSPGKPMCTPGSGKIVAQLGVGCMPFSTTAIRIDNGSDAHQSSSRSHLYVPRLTPLAVVHVLVRDNVPKRIIPHVPRLARRRPHAAPQAA